MVTITQLKVRAEEGERADFPQLGSRYVLRGESSDGRFAVIEHTIPRARSRRRCIRTNARTSTPSCSPAG